MKKLPSLKLSLGFTAFLLTLSLHIQAEPVAIKPSSLRTTDPAPQDIQSVILLTNGDRITGHPSRIDAQKNLEFTSEHLLQKAQFSLSEILSLDLGTWEFKKQPKTIARIELEARYSDTTGDTLLGELQEFTPDSIKLNTWYGGQITLKRSMVKSLQIITTGAGRYYGPNNIKEWTLNGGGKPWSFRNGTLISNGNNGVGRDIQLTEKSHISFVTQWEKYMRFSLQIYSSDISDKNPDAYYSLSFNRSYIHLRTHSKAGDLNNRVQVGRIKANIQPPGAKKAKLDIFTDRKAGTVTVYINGQYACIIQSQNPDPTDLGTGINFVAEQSYPVKISKISSSPWDGKTSPRQNIALDSENKEPTIDSQFPHLVILTNGDIVPGTIGKITDDKILIETEYTPIRIPMARINLLSLGGKKSEKPRMYADDVRGWFHHGGHITLKLSNIKDGKINGYSQALGEVFLDLKALSKIDFSIYNTSYNTLRYQNRQNP